MCDLSAWFSIDKSFWHSRRTNLHSSSNFHNGHTYSLTATTLPGWVTSLHVCVCVCVCLFSSLPLSLCTVSPFAYFGCLLPKKAKQNATMTSTFFCLRFSYTHTKTQSHTHTLNFNVDNCEKCAAKEIARTSSWRQLWAGEEIKNDTHRESGQKKREWCDERWQGEQDRRAHTQRKEERGRGRELRRKSGRGRGRAVFVLLYVRCAISLPCELLKNQRKSTTKIVP